MLKNKTVKNASWIIACRIAKAVCSVIITMLTARYLGPSSFGVINYAASIVTFFVPIMQLGIDAVMVYELTNSPEEEGKIVGTSIVLNFVSAILCMIGVFAFTFVFNHNEPETILVCLLYSILLIFQAVEIVQYWFQYKLLSKYVSISMLAAYFAVSLYKAILLITDKSVYWFAVSHAIDYLIVSVALIVTYIKLHGQKFGFSFSVAKRLLSKGKYYIISNLMIAIFMQTDRIMLKLMVDDAACGFYSAAATCATMTAFVFTAIIDSVRPKIFKDLQTDLSECEKNIRLLYSFIIFLTLLQGIVITLLASPVVHILYGKEYNTAIGALQILIWCSVFSNIGNVRSIWILAMEKQKYLWIVNLVGVLMNIVLNVFMIKWWGVYGASLASLITQIFTNYVVVYFIPALRKNNRLINQSLNFVPMFKVAKSLIKSKEK